MPRRARASAKLSSNCPPEYISATTMAASSSSNTTGGCHRQGGDDVEAKLAGPEAGDDFNEQSGKNRQGEGDEDVMRAKSPLPAHMRARPRTSPTAETSTRAGLI